MFRSRWLRAVPFATPGHLLAGFGAAHPAPLDVLATAPRRQRLIVYPPIALDSLLTLPDLDLIEGELA